MSGTFTFAVIGTKETMRTTARNRADAERKLLAELAAAGRADAKLEYWGGYWKVRQRTPEEQRAWDRGAAALDKNPGHDRPRIDPHTGKKVYPEDFIYEPRSFER